MSEKNHLAEEEIKVLQFNVFNAIDLNTAFWVSIIISKLCFKLYFSFFLFKKKSINGTFS